MNPADVIIIAVVLVILGVAVWYISSSRKKGVQCIGCPDAEACASKGCPGNCGGCSGNCGAHQK
jgi:hypothetical protein